MAILDLNKKNVIAESRPENIENRPYLSQEELKTSTLFSKDHSLDHISQYISGMKWTVTYFLQLRNMNDELVQLDARIPATIQKYHRINKLEIYLQNGIEQANITNIEFEAVINAGFLPNVHDIILAELTGGREALFVLKEIDLKKYSLHDAYWCTFKLLTFVDSDNANLYNNLIFKTVKEYVYDKNHLLDYSAPIILQSDYKRKLNLKDVFREITQYYIDQFLDNDTCVLCPPTETSKYTDIYLTEFLFSIIESTDHPELSKIVRVDKTKLKKVNCTIWDVILKRDITMLKRAERRIGFLYNPYTYPDYMIRNYNMLGINFIATLLPRGMKAIVPDYIELSTYDRYYPKDPEIMPLNTDTEENKPVTLPEVDEEETPNEVPTIPLEPPVTIPSIPIEPPAEIPAIPIEPPKEIPAVPIIPIEPLPPLDPGFTVEPEFENPITKPDEAYVVSNCMYDLIDKDLGILERNLKKYLLGELCDSEEIDKMVSQYHMWSTRDQYYLIPILLVLIKDSIMHTYKQI